MTLIIRLVFLLLFTTSCSFMDKENLLIVKNSITGYPQNIITEQMFLSQKFSFAEVSLGRGPSAILSLRSIENNIFEWQSADGIIIYTYNGFVVKTFGLDNDIETNFKSLEFETPLIQNVSFLRPPLYGIDFELSVLERSQKLIKKGWVNLDTQQILISKSVPFLRWKSIEKFWINKETNLVEKTIQHIHPQLPPIKITFYYKY
tara:strand:- start:297 stop:908 length:612 start_codon:yes stop_codon:yes gene_type:complete